MSIHPAIDIVTGRIKLQHLTRWTSMRGFIQQRMEQQNTSPTVDISANQETEMKRLQERWKRDRPGFEQEMRMWLTDNS